PGRAASRGKAADRTNGRRENPATGRDRRLESPAGDAHVCESALSGPGDFRAPLYGRAERNPPAARGAVAPSRFKDRGKRKLHGLAGGTKRPRRRGGRGQPRVEDGQISHAAISDPGRSPRRSKIYANDLWDTSGPRRAYRRTRHRCP